MLLTFSFDPRFHCQLLLLQRYRFSNYFFENCPLSSVPFPLFRINDHLYYFHGFEYWLTPSLSFKEKEENKENFAAKKRKAFSY